MSAGHGKWALLGVTAAAILVLGLPMAATAQEIPAPDTTDDEESAEQADTQNEGLQRTARTADTGIGEVGQRQTAQDGPAMREPLGRITSRISNRVENRIRNRIDRYYDPTANATSPYEKADRQTRAGPR
ncbi:hypothetical protein [Qipengyuania sp. SM2507]